MYLSKCVINTVSPVNPYQLHRELWKLFPGRPNDGRDFLFRVENLGRKEPNKILLQSKEKPVTNNNSLIAIVNSHVVVYDKLKQNIPAGKLLRFLIRANPTKRIKDESKTLNQGRVRVPLINEDDMKNWLRRQLDDGAKLKELMINGQNVIYFRKGSHAGKVVTATYTGLLEVKESNALMKRVEYGIGPAKAFGCGLLSLARA